MYTEISVNRLEQTTLKMRGKSKKSKPTNQKGKNVERKFIKERLGGGGADVRSSDSDSEEKFHSI